MKKTAALYLAFAICMVMLAGCGGGADENKSIETIKAEIENMDAAKLIAMAEKYKDAIIAKKSEVEPIMAKMKAIPVTELMGNEAKELKSEIEALTKSVGALKTRFDLYYNKIKADGGDVSGLEL